MVGLILGLFALVVLVINFGFNKIVSALDQSDSELQTILSTSRDGIAILDKQTNFLYANNAYLVMTGFTARELYTKSYALLSAPEDMPRAIKILSEVIEKGFVDNFEKTCIVKDNKKVIVNMAIALMTDKERLLITMKDVTNAKKIEQERKKYIHLIDENVITSSTDLEGNIISASQAFCHISGYSKEELIGQNHRIVRHDDMSEETYKQMWQKLANDETWEGELKNRAKDGNYYWVHAKIYPLYTQEGEKYGYTAICTDITDKKRIEELSITDGLTSIYNRRYFNDLFPKFIESSIRSDDISCFILMDVDYFKQYNDTYGHQMGDTVLVQVAKTIKRSLRRTDDYCFRLGGEEFGILFKTQIEKNAVEFAETLRQNIENLHIRHEKNTAGEFVTVSIGLVILARNVLPSCDAIYKQSDDLLYEAKSSGRNQVCFAHMLEPIKVLT